MNINEIQTKQIELQHPRHSNLRRSTLSMIHTQLWRCHFTPLDWTFPNVTLSWHTKLEPLLHHSSSMWLPDLHTKSSTLSPKFPKSPESWHALLLPGFLVFDFNPSKKNMEYHRMPHGMFETWTKLLLEICHVSFSNGRSFSLCIRALVELQQLVQRCICTGNHRRVVGLGPAMGAPQPGTTGWTTLTNHQSSHSSWMFMDVFGCSW